MLRVPVASLGRLFCLGVMAMLHGEQSAVDSVCMPADKSQLVVP